MNFNIFILKWTFTLRPAKIFSSLLSKYYRFLLKIKVNYHSSPKEI